MTVRYLVLWPPAACDLACPYCYRRNRRGGRMGIEVADAALDLVADGVRATGRPAHVQLAGGEPTLVPDLVEHVARRVAAILGGRVTCGIQPSNCLAFVMSAHVAGTSAGWTGRRSICGRLPRSAASCSMIANIETGRSPPRLIVS